MTRNALRVLREEHGVNSRSGNRIARYSAARLVHEDRYEGWLRAFMHNIVTRGCVISDSDGGARARDAAVYYAVAMIATVDGVATYALATRLEWGNSGTVEGYVLRASNGECVELTERVRRVGVAELRGSAINGGAGAEPNNNVTMEGVYELWPRARGYPPHMG